MSKHRLKNLFCLFFFVTSFTGTGCGEAETKPPTNGATNVATNIATNSGGPSVTFVLNNDTDTSIFIDGNCSATWYRLKTAEGEVVQPSLGCSSCRCGVESCAVCGACPNTPPVELVPGETLEWTWQGIYWASSTDEFRDSCREQRQFTTGTFAAEFCYGFDAAEFGVADLECRTQSFELGADTRVQHIPEPPANGDPACDSADSNGFFPNCDVCGDDCDEIDSPNASGFACGCSTGGCPCGLRCGSYEIAPNVVVDNICVR